MATPRLADLLARREQVAIERDALTLRLRRIDGEIALLMARTTPSRPVAAGR